MEKIFNRIKNLTNAYSESMQNIYKVGTNVTVGGQIKSINDVSLLLSSSEAIIDFSIDDGLGVFTLRIFQSLLDQIEEQYGKLSIGDFIISNGLFAESIMDEGICCNLVIGTIIKHLREGED